MKPKLELHYHEKMPSDVARMFRSAYPGERKIALWNAFVDSGLLGIIDDDCSALPRVLPSGYLKTISRSCEDIALFLMKLLSLPSREIESMLPHTPVRDFLVSELCVLKHRPDRLTGCMRFDMAIAGRPIPSNPPKLLEVNEIGFDGTGRSSFIQDTIFKLYPELRSRFIALDTARSEARNMRRITRNIARICYDSYNWEDEVLQMKAREAGVEMRLVSPTAFKVDIDSDCAKLSRRRVSVRNGRLYTGNEIAGAFQLNYSMELSDYKEGARLFGDLVRARIPHYSPFFTGLVATKTILVLLSDQALVKRLIGPERARRMSASILPAVSLDGNEGAAEHDHNSLVLKHGDGMGGEMVYVGSEMHKVARRIPAKKRCQWVLQERMHLNSIDVQGILSRPRRVISDLGVYIHYDWNGSRFTNFAIGGFISRGTNRSLKVNVSGGGIQIPVLFDKKR